MRLFSLTRIHLYWQRYVTQISFNNKNIHETNTQIRKCCRVSSKVWTRKCASVQIAETVVANRVSLIISKCRRRVVCVGDDLTRTCLNVVNHPVATTAICGAQAPAAAGARRQREPKACGNPVRSLHDDSATASGRINRLLPTVLAGKVKQSLASVCPCVCPSVCFHSIFWTDWPLNLISSAWGS